MSAPWVLHECYMDPRLPPPKKRRSCPSWPGGASAARSATSSFKVDSSCKNISFPSGSATCTWEISQIDDEEERCWNTHIKKKQDRMNYDDISCDAWFIMIDAVAGVTCLISIVFRYYIMYNIYIYTYNNSLFASYGFLWNVSLPLSPQVLVQGAPSDSGLTGTNGSSMSGITTARKRPWLVGT